MAPTQDGRGDPSSMLVLTLPNQVFFPSMRGTVDVPRSTFEQITAHLEKTGATGVGAVALRPSKKGTAPSPYEIGTFCHLVQHNAGNAQGDTAGGEGGGDTVQLSLEGKTRFRVLKYTRTSPVRIAAVEFIEDPTVDDQSVAVRALLHSVHDKLSELIKQAQDRKKLAIGKQNWKWPSSAPLLADMVGAMMTQLSVEERQRILETLDVRQRMELVMDLLQRETEAQRMSSEIHNSMQKAREVEIRQAMLQRQMQEVRKSLQRIRDKAGKGDADGLEEKSDDEDDEQEETARLAEMVQKAGLPGDAKRIAKKELRRLKNIQPQHPEYTITHTYLELLCSLPWKSSTQDRFDLARARSVLDADHKGLEKVKGRVLEFLAVQKLRGNMRGPILCLHGPPGIGKTSLGRSIASSLGRKFHRIALGGVRDEAELRGHRRTYIGSMPGTIIQAFQTLGVNNPVILLDEVDKMSQNQMFNPQATLLEILDPEQNSTFKDHYVNTAFDLSKVLFIATANDTSLIDRPLLDRMEVIDLAGYTVDEKIGIAETHLLTKQRRLHALEPELVLAADHGDSLPSGADAAAATRAAKGSAASAVDPESQESPDGSFALDAVPLEDPRLVVTPAALKALITKWTAESGVRTLERRLAQLCRWAALRLQGVDTGADANGERDEEREAALESCGPDVNGRVTVDAHHLPSIVGVELFEPDIAERLTVGVAMGLSVSAVGGQILFIEATRTLGNGKLTITGQLGKVMLESVETAMSLLRSRFRMEQKVPPLPLPSGSPATASDDGDSRDPFKGEDIHVHFPAGGIPKDGPSAGVAVLLALSSLLFNQPMRSDTAVTGEVSLRGHVLPIGGVRDKILAAHRAGIRHVLVPLANKRHVLEDVPFNTLDGLEVHYLKHVDEAVAWAFGRPPPGSQRDSTSDAAEQWVATTELPPGLPAAAAAATRDRTGTVFLPPLARL